MKCPLMLKTWQATVDKVSFQPMDCPEGACAWWDREGKKCNEVRKAEALDRLGEIMADIKRQMPPVKRL